MECNIEYHLVGEVASHVGQCLPAHLGLDILRRWGGVNLETLRVIHEVIAATGDRPKGAGGASAPPRKNNSACRNENRAIVSTVMKILSEQKLEVC